MVATNEPSNAATATVLETASGDNSGTNRPPVDAPPAAAVTAGVDRPLADALPG